MSHVMNTYARQPVAFVRGEGVWLWDDQGRRYLDMLSAYSAVSFGYGHPKLIAAFTEQAKRLAVTSRRRALSQRSVATRWSASSPRRAAPISRSGLSGQLRRT